jgi:hypothetical protein
VRLLQFSKGRLTANAETDSDFSLAYGTMSFRCIGGAIMETARLTIKGDQIRKIAALLAKREDIYYKYETKDVVILMDEEYYFRIESTLMSLYILDFKDEQSVIIEVVSGGGSHGVSSLGAETKEVVKGARSIIELCKENGWEISDVYPEDFMQLLEKTATEKLMESVLSWFKK